jgi:hypothetical protein
MPSISEGSRGGLRRDNTMSRDVTLSSRCRDVTRGHDLGLARHRPPGSRASVRDRTRRRAPAPVLWRRAAARPSATATREVARYPEPLQRARDTTEPRDITGSQGTGTQDRSSALRGLPCLPWSGSRPPAGVEEGPKWREQSQFAERSKCLWHLRLSDGFYPASRANKANFAGPCITISATHLIWRVYAGWGDAHPSSLIRSAQSKCVAIYSSHLANERRYRRRWAGGRQGRRPPPTALPDGKYRPMDVAHRLPSQGRGGAYRVSRGR